MWDFIKASVAFVGGGFAAMLVVSLVAGWLAGRGRNPFR